MVSVKQYFQHFQKEHDYRHFKKSGSKLNITVAYCPLLQLLLQQKNCKLRPIHSPLTISGVQTPGKP